MVRFLFHGTTERSIDSILKEGLMMPVYFGDFRTASYFAISQANLRSTPRQLDQIYLIAKSVEELSGGLIADQNLIDYPVNVLGLPPRVQQQERWQASKVKSWETSFELNKAACYIKSNLPVSESEVIPLRNVGLADDVTDGSARLGAIKKWNRKGAKTVWQCAHTHSEFASALSCATAEIANKMARQRSVAIWRKQNQVGLGELIPISTL